MVRIKLVAILLVCPAVLLFISPRIFAQEIPPAWYLNGGVYQMISSPYMPQDRDPQASLVDNLGPYNKTQWRLFRYDPVQFKYIELKSPEWGPDQDFDFGIGYWIISRNSTEIDIEGSPVVGDQLTLKHDGDGWNQIGNIFSYDFPIASLYVVRITDPDPLLNRVQLIDAVNNGLTYVTLQESENGSYIDIPGNGKNSLEVGKGYWLRVREGVGEDVILWFVVRGPNALSKEVYLSEEFFERIAQQEDPPDPPAGVESSSSVSFSGGSGSGGCFIATATYGNYDHPKVQFLRKFRDRYLLTNSLGRRFVGLYYRYSPTLAAFVAKRDSMKVLVRLTLMPMIGMSGLVSKMNLYGFLIVLAFSILMGFFLVIRSGGGGGKCKPTFSITSGGRKRKR